MNSSPWSRRRLLIALGGLPAMLSLLQACGSAAPVSPTSAPQSTTARPTASAAAPAQATSKPSGQVSISIAVRPESSFAWQAQQAKTFAQQHPEINVQVFQVAYGDMPKKQLTMLATNTLPDVLYSGNKWFAYTAYKGAFEQLDSYVKAAKVDLSQFFKTSVVDGQLEGKLYGLPYDCNYGNQNTLFFNKDILADRGVTPPTDDWTMDDFTNLCKKVTDTKNHVFGTNFLTENYYDFACLARTLGGDILSQDAKQLTLTTDPKALQAMQWEIELRTKPAVAPNRSEAQAQGMDFYAGKIVFWASGVYSFVPAQGLIKDKFKWDVVLAPKGPTGLRGYEAFATLFSLSVQSKSKDQAFDLITVETSEESGQLGFAMGTVPSRPAIWQSAAAQKMSTIWSRAATWLSDSTNKGPFPMPWNFRFSELQDKWQNLADQVFYGDVPFDAGVKQIQDQCGQIVGLPRA